MENMNQDFNINNDDDNKEKKNKKKNRILKGTGIALCAVLAGGLAFEGISSVSGWNFSNTVKASNTEENKTEHFKNKKENRRSKKKKLQILHREPAEEPSETKVKGSLDVSDIAAEAMKSVVAITTKSVQEVQTYIGDFGFGGFTTQEQEVEGSGSGIIVGKNDESLLIATNYHVIQGARYGICYLY